MCYHICFEYKFPTEKLTRIEPQKKTCHVNVTIPTALTTHQTTNMLTRTELCDMQANKIRQARMALTMGMHDPTLMYEIAQLREIIHVVVEFENKLFNDNMDID
jgi:hypothetical protein